MSNTFTSVYNPRDPVYMMNRQKQLKELSTQPTQLLIKQLDWMMRQDAPRDESGETTRNIMADLHSPHMPVEQLRTKGIIDSTQGATLIRQDLEPIFYSLFVRAFPAFERIRKGQANGLVHAYNQMTAPDTLALGGSLISELGTVSYTNTTLQRQTTPISVFATGRGVSIKEEAAIKAGGMNWDAPAIELGNAMVRLAMDVQYQILQGNYSNTGGTAAQEAGQYNALGFDGFRGVTGSVGVWSGNNAVQVDIASLNITESMQFEASRIANNGGMVDMALMTMNAKQALDTENQTNQRYNNDYREVIAGVKVQGLQWANGIIDLMPIPGNTMGAYNRTSDGALVEDIYLLDSTTITLRWLHSEGMTVLEIPSGVDGQLTNRFIVFCMYGLEQAAPIFSGKVRRSAA